MDDFKMHLMELSAQGFQCAQILLILRLESDGEENPGLVRAMGGLSGGMGFSGKACGALTGGACLIGYYAAQGDPDEMPDSRLNEMVAELVQWFDAEFGEKYGGSECACILGGDMENKKTRCPSVVEAVYFKCMDILAAGGYELD